MAITGLTAVIPDAVAFATLEQVARRTLRLSTRPFDAMDICCHLAEHTGRIARLVIAVDRDDDQLEEDLLETAAYCADAAGRLARRRRNDAA